MKNIITKTVISIFSALSGFCLVGGIAALSDRR